MFGRPDHQALDRCTDICYMFLLVHCELHYAQDNLLTREQGLQQVKCVAGERKNFLCHAEALTGQCVMCSSHKGQACSL